jgi:hemoglobin
VTEASLFDALGGEGVILALCASLHGRCLADPVLNHPFGHPRVRPDHVERLAAYLTEVTGGPARYRALGADHSDMLVMHAGEGDTTELGARFLECFLAAADDVGAGADAGLRAALASAMASAVAEVVAYPVSADDVPRGLATPRWGPDGTVAPG